ncbi:hypothetical protein [Syntrophobacter fumaroxidans]|uniref:Uncharacterized protein n=1 Tax=Syntrophobacter fumaroxidans (strain DSM 10017 / MPOB) TaxID=335543 RepID=A0LHC0_SYNFM|nr:hypothetical protein [Syntrophobacter fumaroxidans]ABK16822.1 hypothetical protein Sfum_1129 [Syntrophobacter fumaroxidans MPOB]
MSKEELLLELEEEMKHFFCKGITDDFIRFSMENAVESFVRKEAARMGEDELLEKFGTMEDAFKLFIEFLRGKGVGGKKLADYYRRKNH